MLSTSPAWVLVLWIGSALVMQAPTTSPAPPAAFEPQLEQCMKQCRNTFTTIEDSLRLIERAQASQDPDVLNATLRQIRSELMTMRQQMSSCLQQLERAEHPGTVVSGPAIVTGMWACPMHAQIRQDSPGNCPVCDATFRPIADPGISSTRPAVATVSDRPGTVPLRSTAGR
jgi:hypothetical protein